MPLGLRRLGSEGEDRAAAYLLDKGYTVVARRVKTRSGEIDLVALDGEVLVLVEVKLRRTDYQKPEEAVGPTKVRRFDRAAAEYLHSVGGPERAVRYDLIAIDRDGLRHYENAFLGQDAERPPIEEIEED